MQEGEVRRRDSRSDDIGCDLTRRRSARSGSWRFDPVAELSVVLCWMPSNGRSGVVRTVDGTTRPGSTSSATDKRPLA